MVTVENEKRNALARLAEGQTARIEAPPKVEMEPPALGAVAVDKPARASVTRPRRDFAGRCPGRHAGDWAAGACVESERQ